MKNNNTLAPIQVVGKEGLPIGTKFVVMQLATGKYAGYLGNDPWLPEEVGKLVMRCWYTAKHAAEYIDRLEAGKIHDNVWVD